MAYKRLPALANNITKANENTTEHKKDYWLAQSIKLDYKNDLYVQKWLDAAWGKVAENNIPLLEVWSQSNTLPAVDIKIVRAIGGLRNALKPGGFPKGNVITAYSPEITYWCYTIHDLIPTDRARVLSALTVKLPNDLVDSIYTCWEQAWSSANLYNKTPEATVWEWLGPSIFDDTPIAIKYLCSESNMQPVIESMLQSNTESKELPLLWKATHAYHF